MFAKVPPTRHHQSVAQPSRDSRTPQLSAVRERGTEVLITITQTAEMATAKEEATGLNASEVVSQHGCLLSGADGAPDQLVEGAQLLEGDLADVLEDGPNHVLGAGRGRQRSAIPEGGISTVSRVVLLLRPVLTVLMHRTGKILQ